jgi:hypothetical protein
MADTFVISGLHRKRAHLAGEVEKAQRALDRQKATLATLDAVIRLFEPDGNPELIPAIRPVSRRCFYFRRGEVPRLCLSALRESARPVQARWVAEYAMRAKGLDVEPLIAAQITEAVRQALARLEAKGVVRKLIQWPDTWWELAGSSD